MNLDRVLLPKLIIELQNAIEKAYGAICESLTQADRYSWLKMFSMLPKLTPTAILTSIKGVAVIDTALRPAIIAYALLIRQCQRLSRIDSALRQNNIHMVKQELANNGGHTVWKPEDHPDWLLLEIENNLSIRSQQYDVAMQMMSPSSGSNAIVQLNMEQGKTSVITPMICAELANVTCLVRAVVA